jgi:hypothetical protein
MTNRENQRRLDKIAPKYLDALAAEDFDAIAALWEQAAQDADLEAMLHALNAEFVAEMDRALDAAVIEQIEKHLPSAAVVAPANGPLRVAEVAEHLRRHPPAGLSIDDLTLNDLLRTIDEEVPLKLGISQVIAWGGRYGTAPEAYWQAFREAALTLRMQRDAEAPFRMAARSTKPMPPRPREDTT